jgi:hypothetical protein
VHLRESLNVLRQDGHCDGHPRRLRADRTAKLEEGQEHTDAGEERAAAAGR